MADNTALNTTINEPSMTAGEVEMLLFVLDRSRAQFAWKAGGLDDAALRRTQPPSALTLGGLLKHLALVEDHYSAVVLAGTPMPDAWSAYPPDDHGWEFRSAADDSAEELYALWSDAVARSRAIIDHVLADGGLDQPTKHTFGDKTPNVRRILYDVHDEYARHVGHADLLREAIDGLVGEDPPQT